MSAELDRNIVPAVSPATAESRTSALARRIGAAEVAVACIVAAVAASATIGGDSRWAAALGRTIVANGSIPRGVPYASAPSGDWPNVPVLAEVVTHWLAALGDRGFLIAQVVAVALGFAVLAVDMRRFGAHELGSAIAVALVLVGAGASFFVIRIQLFSLVLFPLLALVLRAETRSPSRRVWLVPALLALWSNLHGAALIGLAVAAAYLVFERARKRPLEAAVVLVVSIVGLCATTALERTPDYYRGVLENEAARRGVGLWAPLSLSSKTDLVLLAAGGLLVGLALWRRPRLWEAIAMAGLAFLTVKTARSGVWLLFFAAVPAAAALPGSFRIRRPWPAAVVVALALVTAYEIATATPSRDASAGVVAAALANARGTAILADGRSAEQVALAGGRVWMGNPLDAFARRDQQLYLNWLDGRSDSVGAYAHAPRVVLVHRDGPADRLTSTMRQFRAAGGDANAVVYVRRR